MQRLSTYTTALVSKSSRVGWGSFAVDIELGGDFASSMLFGKGIDVGDEGRGDHRRFVPRARQPHRTLYQGTRFKPHADIHLLQVSL